MPRKIWVVKNLVLIILAPAKNQKSFSILKILGILIWPRIEKSFISFWFRQAENPNRPLCSFPGRSCLKGVSFPFWIFGETEI